MTGNAKRDVLLGNVNELSRCWDFMRKSDFSRIKPSRKIRSTEEQCVWRYLLFSDSDAWRSVAQGDRMLRKSRCMYISASGNT